MIKKIIPEYTSIIPDVLKEGILYVSFAYQTASHLCGCGCGEKVVTPLREGGWSFVNQADKITLHPSIANRFECKSHYYIKDGEIKFV